MKLIWFMNIIIFIYKLDQTWSSLTLTKIKRTSYNLKWRE